MKFCSNCGAQLPEGTKFCQECGQRIVNQEPVQPVYEAPVQQSYEAPQQSYAPPVQQSYETPQQSYTPPVQQSYEAPQQSYAPPVQQSYEATQQSYVPPVQQSYEAPQQSYTPSVQQSYEAPQQSYTPPTQSGNSGSYTPPTQSGGGSYVPPTAPGKAPKAPKEKKPLNKKVLLFAGIAVVAIVLVVVLIAALGGKGKDDANLGRYEGVSCDLDGLVMPLDGDWIELKAKGKAALSLSGDEFNATWSVDGEKFTLEQSGDKYTGTLKDGVLSVDLGGLVYTFAKEGAKPGTTGNTAGEANPSGGTTEAAAEAGYWTLLRADSSAGNAMSEEDVALYRELGIEIFVDLKEDGTGVLVFDSPVNITWADGVITADDGTKLSYTLQDDLLQIKMDTEVYVMTRGEGSAPDISTTASMGGEDEGDDWGDDWGDLYSDYDWWSGTWYGWYVISNANSAYESNINNAYDVTATIEVYADDTGYVDIVDIDGDDVCWCSVTFGPGITENGCMMSEEGSIFGFDIGHADWIVDPGASMVSDFDYMIEIDGTIVDEDGDWFDYKLFLRPWGMEWEDIRYADTSNMLYDDMMPLYYDDWYLPQLDGSVS